MDRKTKQKRKALGYEVEEDKSSTEDLTNQNKIPAWVFGYSALASFIIGIIGLIIEVSNDHLDNIILFFSLSFFLAPALLTYPVFRYVAGEGKTGIAVLLSAIYGYYIQSEIKKKMKK